jgi:predicted RND superfamily exporter protein
MDADSAIRKALYQVGLACFLTSLTTAIGFSSLTLARHEWVQEFGWCSVIGVGLMFISVVTVIPLIAVTPLGRNLHAGHEKSLIDRNLQKIGGLVESVLRRPVLFSTLGIVLTIVFTAVSLTLRPDEKRSTALPESSEVARALRHMDDVLGGLEFSAVEVRWTPDVDSESSEILDVVTEVDDLLHTEPLIGYPLSIRNLIDSLPGEGSSVDRFPMVELLPPPLKRAFFTPETRTATVTFRVQDLGIARFGPVFERLQQGLQEIQQRHPSFRMQLEGSAVWRWENLYRMVIDLAASLGTAAAIILCVMALAFRSLRIGLISIVPNIFPLALTGTWLAWSGQPLELVSVLSFTICLGIAVDDSIHFLTRFTEETSRTTDLQAAIRNAFGGVGVALVMTTVVLVTGFSTVAFSDSHDHHIFATMGGLTIASALLADLIFLPAMLSRFAASPKVAAAAQESADASREAASQPA